MIRRRLPSRQMKRKSWLRYYYSPRMLRAQDEYGLSMAAIAAYGHQIGAVIVAPNGRVVGSGRGDEGDPRTVHAEAAAIVQAGRDRCLGATLYVNVGPCMPCRALISDVGIARLVVVDRCGKCGHTRADAEDLSEVD